MCHSTASTAQFRQNFLVAISVNRCYYFRFQRLGGPEPSENEITEELWTELEHLIPIMTLVTSWLQCDTGALEKNLAD